MEAGNTDLPINSNIFIVSGKINSTLRMSECFRPHPTLNVRSELRWSILNDKDFMDILLWTRCSLLGFWHYTFGLYTLPQNRLEKRSDLSGVIFRTAANNDPPFVRTVNLEEGVSSPMEGHLQDTRIGLDNIHLGPSLYGDLWESLQKLMNFNYTMVMF